MTNLCLGEKSIIHCALGWDKPKTTMMRWLMQTCPLSLVDSQQLATISSQGNFVSYSPVYLPSEFQTKRFPVGLLPWFRPSGRQQLSTPTQQYSDLADKYLTERSVVSPTSYIIIITRYILQQIISLPSYPTIRRVLK